MTSMDGFPQVLEAIRFASRVHRHQVRKDGETPYASHVCRVAMIVRHVFGCQDPRVLTAAVLHDTIEDTPTDYDDLASLFGDEVAGWVSTLTKDMRLPEARREEAYLHALTQAEWPVILCKLADIYDNLSDSQSLSLPQRQRSMSRAKVYLQAIGPVCTTETEQAYQQVEGLYQTLERELASAT